MSVEPCQLSPCHPINNMTRLVSVAVQIVVASQVISAANIGNSDNTTCLLYYSYLSSYDAMTHKLTDAQYYVSSRIH